MQESAPTFQSVTMSLAAAGLLWILPNATQRDIRQIALFNSLALGAGIHAAIESKRLLRQNKLRAVGVEVELDLIGDKAELVYQYRLAQLKQQFGLADGGMAKLGEQILEPVWAQGGAGDFPVEDLAHTLATATNSGTLIVAPSGCGKTRLLQHAIYKADQAYDSQVDFQILDCKGEEEGFLGLEKSPNDFCLLDDDTAREGLSQLMLMKGQLKRVDSSIPYIAVIDEWNNGVASLNNAPDIKKDDKLQAVSAARQIVTKGRSKRLFGWLTTHTPETKTIGFDSATRQSLNIIILARGNKLGLIASVLKNVYSFVDDDTTRSSLLAKYQAFMAASSPAQREQPIALTNICGDWRLVRLPDYRDAPPQLKRNVLNGGSELEELDEEPEPSPKSEAVQPAAKIRGRVVTGASRSKSSQKFSPEYLTYLKSPEWQQRRQRIEPKRCSGCGSTQRLELNHTSYPAWGCSLEDLINQPDADFAWLCHDCHRAVTLSTRKRSRKP